MNKRVNGTIVEIDNINLFVEAMEGMKQPGLIAMDTNVPMSTDVETVNKLLADYESIYKKLPYPLYSTEANIKYVTIGRLLADKYNHKQPMWVSNGLCIKLADDSVLKFKGRNYIFEKDTQQGESINFLRYKTDASYPMFFWIYNRIMDNKNTTEFYREFFRGLVEACKDSKRLKLELGNILNFKPVPPKQQFKDNTVLDITRHKQYTLDIYTDKVISSPTKQVLINPDGKPLTHREVTERVYDFVVYAKDCKDNRINSADLSKMYKIDYLGLAGIFEKLIGQGTLTETLGTINYQAVCINNTVLYEIRGVVYKCSLVNYTKPVCVLKNAKLYSVTDTTVYIQNVEKMYSGVLQTCIYAFDISKETLFLCKVDYT